MTSTSEIKAELVNLLHQQGFELVGFARPEPPLHLATYLDWIASGRHAGMAYLATERALRRRANPAEILPEVRTIVVVGLRYSNPIPQDAPSGNPSPGRVAAYALGRDYHEIIPPRLEQAALVLQERLGILASRKAYTDSGPILERDYAMAAGLGWIGKNTCLISPQHGSYFLLGELCLDIELEADPPFVSDQCGTCTRCIQACPTDCILPDRTLDSARCISYLTIENKGEIPVDLRSKLGEWIFGCDICQQVCPWNLRFAAQNGDPALDPQEGNGPTPLHAELRISPQEFNRKFKGRALLRARRRGYLRNVAVALGNAQDLAALPDLRACLLHEAEPLVRAHAAWALGQFDNEEARSALTGALEVEHDPGVLAEIRHALHLPA